MKSSLIAALALAATAGFAQDVPHVEESVSVGYVMIPCTVLS